MINKPLLERLQLEAKEIFSDVSGILSVVISTSDGFELTSFAKSGIDTEKFAALTSSISAIGEVITNETDLGTYSSMTINVEKGFLLIGNVSCKDMDLVIAIIAGKDAVFAQALYRLRIATKRIHSYKI